MCFGPVHVDTKPLTPHYHQLQMVSRHTAMRWSDAALDRSPPQKAAPTKIGNASFIVQFEFGRPTSHRASPPPGVFPSVI